LKQEILIEESEHINHSIAFIDTEIDPKSQKILDIGSVKDNGAYFHKTSVSEFIFFLRGTKYVCGHNIFKHDIM
jgi:ATP-dependent DNA helicase RecQ